MNTKLYVLWNLAGLISFSRSFSYVIDNSGGYGRVFNGIGGISGGGATSKLLVNYPEPQRSEILDYLFKPHFGASLQTLKVEIGGDGQSTEGTESSHMHGKHDLNYKRGYEWWMMSEAKKRNPDIQLYGLPWVYPGWLGRKDPYEDVERTAKYIAMWLQGAKWVHGYDINYIGIWNELPYNTTYIKTLRKVLDRSGMENTQIVADDGNNWDISQDILKDKDLAQAIYAIGTHYPGTMSTSESQATDKPLWSSEDYSTVTSLNGAGCWARILNQNYVNGHMTSTIAWNLIAAYYSDLPAASCGLMTSKEPWSGHYVVEAPIWISAHTTQFTEPGWMYLKHGQGVGKLAGGGSYVTLMGKLDGSDHMTVVIETTTHNNSVCVRPQAPPYTVVPQTATFNITGSMASVKKLFVWYSYLGHGKPQLFMNKTAIQVTQGQFSVQLGRDEVWTISTYSGGRKGSFDTSIPQSKLFPTHYEDNFDNYELFSEASDFVSQVGVWEVRVKTVGSGVKRDPGDPDPGDKCNTQVVQQKPVEWCDVPDLDKPINIGGNFNWSDADVSVDVGIPAVQGADGVFLALRVDRGGCGVSAARGIFFWVSLSQQQFIITEDYRGEDVVISGNLPTLFFADKVNAMSLSIQNNMLKAGWNNETIAKLLLPPNISNHGFVAYGTSSFGLAEFDNFVVNSYFARRG